MSLFNVISTASSALNAQTVRLNLTASNLANAETVAQSEDDAYRTQRPVFKTMVDEASHDQHATGVAIDGIDESQATIPQVYNPDHPLANDEGFIFTSNVNPIEEMADMISASRSYQNNVEVMNTTKELLMRTLSLGR